MFQSCTGVAANSSGLKHVCNTIVSNIVLFVVRIESNGLFPLTTQKLNPNQQLTARVAKHVWIVLLHTCCVQHSTEQSQLSFSWHYSHMPIVYSMGISNTLYC